MATFRHHRAILSGTAEGGFATGRAQMLWRAFKIGLLGLLVGPAVAVAAVIAAMIFDPKCGPGDSGGCAMGLVTVPVAVALPSFALFFGLRLAADLWRARPSIRQLRNWGREE